MPWTTVAKLFVLTTIVFFIIDLVWIGVVANAFYQKHLGFMLRPDVRWAPAVAFYLLFIAGLLVFAVLPGLERQSLARAVVLGGFLGLVAYATYDLTSLALTKGFPGIVAAVDMVWGTVLAGTVSAAGYGWGRWLGL